MYGIKSGRRAARRIVVDKKYMKELSKMTKEELLELKNVWDKEYEEVKAKGIKLDMSRGKPSKAQLDLAMGMMDVLNSQVDLSCEDGTDCRNYGIMDGIEEAKTLLASLTQVSPDRVMIFGSSSLNIMFDTVSRAYTHGILGNTPWGKLDKVKFLCPSPGYDRHFAISEYFGMEMITIPMTKDGPDMDRVEELVKDDESIKGIWCVPKYSNPQGYTYSEETIQRFIHLQPKAKDFRIFWDNAYCVHHVKWESQDEITEIVGACEKAGNPDIVFKFFSTSKISFPGSGISGLASSKANIAEIKNHMSKQTICHDKVNQLRHVRFFKDINGINAHMKKHADIMRPKFDLIIETFERELADLKIAEWTNPNGGYFISFEAMEDCAKAVVKKAKEAGLVLTSAGATYPYGKDPKDSNIRIAPSFPSLEELKIAVDLFVLCVKIVSVEKLLKS